MYSVIGKALDIRTQNEKVGADSAVIRL